MTDDQDRGEDKARSNERAEPDAAERIRLERERMERERAARAQVDREEKERELRSRERVFTERMDRDRQARERASAEQAGERVAREASLDLDRMDRDRLARERLNVAQGSREGGAGEFVDTDQMDRDRMRERAYDAEPMMRERVYADDKPDDRRDDRFDDRRDDMQRLSHHDVPSGVQQRLYEAEQSQSRRRMIGVIVLVALAAAGYWGWLEWQKRRPAAEPVAVAPAPAKQEAAPAGPPAIQHPIAPTNEPLPALADSDAVVTKALGELVGAGRLADVIVPGNVVRKIVASVDNAGRQQLYTRTTPLKPPPSKFMVTGSGDARTINPRNAARYAIYAQVVEQVDAQKFATTYQRHYPLFQQAYEELGYPGRYFNDRLVEVIDLLLATPEAPAAPALVQPKVNFEYADPRLESLSAGQKALVRMGPTESARIKTKLREIRAAISAQPAPAPTASVQKGGG